MFKNKLKHQGFTIVELLIVIVVIGILAAITIVAYNGIQARANDSKTRSIARQIETGIKMWHADNGAHPRGGWSSTASFDGTNCGDGSGGWIFRTAYSCTLDHLLTSKNYTPSNLGLNAPPNTRYTSSATDGRYSFMFYPCNTTTGQFALYYALQSPTAEDDASVAAVEAAGCSGAPRVTYGMRGAKLITLN